jgi:hypothetical protein
MADRVLYEDQGTNSGLTDPDEGDFLNAANLGALAWNPNAVDFHADLTVNADFGANTVDLSAFTAKVEATGVPSPNDTQDRNYGVFYADVDARAGVALTDAATNHVYLTVDLTVDDAVSIAVNTTGTEPAGAALKLAIIDTAADTVDVVNSAPDISADTLTASAVNADTLLTADLANAADNQILVTDGNGNLTVETQAEGPNPYDQAQTFAESGVTITHNKTVVSSGSIELGFLEGTTVSRPVDDGSFSGDSSRGLEINPNTDLDGIKVKLSSNLGNPQDVLLIDANKNIIDQDTSGHSAGDIVNLTGSLTSGDDYYVGTYNDGNSYTIGEVSGTSYPYSSTDIDITSGARYFTSGEGSIDLLSNNAYCIVDVTALSGDATSGDALIEWDNGVPTDIFEWDVATFTRTLDNETVTVDVEDGSGTVLLSDIDRNTDISSVAANTNVKLRANFSRNDTSNNPTLDSAYRSWLV